MKHIKKSPLAIAIYLAMPAVMLGAASSAYAIPNAAGMAEAEAQIENAQLGSQDSSSLMRTTYIKQIQGSGTTTTPVSQTTIEPIAAEPSPASVAQNAPETAASKTGLNDQTVALLEGQYKDGHSHTADESQAMLHSCASVINDGMRLACYDAITQGDKPLEVKRQLQLGQTILETVRGNPQLVYSEPRTTTVSSADDTVRLSAIAERYTPLSLAYDLDRNNTPLWSTRPHNPMYVLPLSLNTRPNREPSTPTQAARTYTPNEMRTPELKFQLSFKVKAMEGLFNTDADLWVGYTQQSHWQVYNEDNSRQFRVHDYQPEVFVTQPIHADLPMGGKMRLLGAGFVHHSNGEKDPLSRSWNRAYLMAGMEWDKLTVMPRLWARVVDGEGSGKPDDNPDILDYYGYGDVKFLYQLDSGSNISGTARFNPSTKKGALQLDYVHPLGRGISGYVQLFHGYGQSLIDYNHEATSIGIGVMLNDWMGL